MASLMENLIETLDCENKEYQTLIGLSREKTPVIIEGNLDKLAEITGKEQLIVEKIQSLEKNRIQHMKDIAEVTNTDFDTLNLAALIDMMKGRQKEQTALMKLHDELKTTMRDMQAVNNQNRELLKSSLEMVEFEMNLINSMRRAPETADYNKNAYNTGSIMGSGTKRFDSKS